MRGDRGMRTEPRGRLRRERVLKTAMGQADHGGLEALTMRSLADELGVAPMSISPTRTT